LRPPADARDARDARRAGLPSYGDPRRHLRVRRHAPPHAVGRHRAHDSRRDPPPGPPTAGRRGAAAHGIGPGGGVGSERGPAAHAGGVGLGMAGPKIMAHGSDEQKQRYLPKIRSAEEIWCQGFSEPDAGSDLAAARTRAERRGDVFVVNGQKVWSSFAHIADWCILIGLSDPDAPRYKGLTYMMVDMHAPGVEVRPLRQITGEAEFNEIFFTDVEVPADNLLGEIGGGWAVAMTTLLHERATLGFALSGVL